MLEVWLEKDHSLKGSVADPVANPGGDPCGAKEHPFGLDLVHVLDSTDDRQNGTTLSG